ncbi:STAS domain-containing protein [Nonomuraea sp. NPDC050556]|uniref:STAS domain-containing protein n=1 Tax=Nonomuraea sp. NPDC050556 TaxID=3364369 RepID=UPI0037A725BF
MQDFRPEYTLKVQLAGCDGRAVLRIAGALDRVSVPVLTAHLDVAWGWNDEPDLVIDASGVTGCDRAGVAAFAVLAQRLLDGGRGRVALVAVAGQLKRALRRARLLERFELYDSLPRPVQIAGNGVRRGIDISGGV